MIYFIITHILASHYAGTKATIAGWGSINERGDQSCVLNEIKVPILTNLECVQFTAYAPGMITENMMCAGYLDGEQDACQVIFLRTFLG